jgi:uncharacterized protein
MFSVVMAASIATGLYDFSYHGPASAWRGASLALESGILEEVIVRGVVLRLVWRAFGPIVAFVVSGLLFGAGHIANPGATLFTTACVAIEAGVMLGSFYALRGRLWVSIGVHAGWNFTQGYIFGALVSGGDFGASLATSTPRPGLPTWLTGGAFGPEASVPAFAVCSTVGAVVLWLAWRGNRVPRKAEWKDAFELTRSGHLRSKSLDVGTLRGALRNVIVIGQLDPKLTHILTHFLLAEKITM